MVTFKAGDLVKLRYFTNVYNDDPMQFGFVLKVGPKYIKVYWLADKTTVRITHNWLKLIKNKNS